ncbi:MAG: ABC transporter ATP-binding protein [Candidatus Saccharibacteria bacterium]|nr:ABC transporter ATP-binding protein [Candidatus Saccharibacteria bacterium]
MKYALNNTSETAGEKKISLWKGIKKLSPLVDGEQTSLLTALVSVLINSGLTIAAPILVGHAVDNYIVTRRYHGVIVYSAILLAIYAGMLISGFIQTRIMGGVGQRILFRLRGKLFDRIQGLPVAFFNQNKAGDLISRINNDTDKLNQFFSRSLVQFVGNIFIIIGAGIAMLVVNHRLGIGALLPALGLLVLTRLTSAWIKRKNKHSLQTLGALSGEIQESLENFRVIVAFNRRNYFRERFIEVNEKNYSAAIWAGIANNTYVPIFGFVSNLGTLIVITYGLTLISRGELTIGIMISYLAYVSRFYDPLRQMASIWSDLQTALAAWERISQILEMKSNLVIIEDKTERDESKLMSFHNVNFSYETGKNILKDVSFELEQSKIYALVGPTGGGKSTTASLMARLYDPTTGKVLLHGKDIRSFTPDELASKIGFILQDPFLFSGTVRDNIVYGNEKYQKIKSKDLAAVLEEEGLSTLLERFDQGLDTKVSASASSISLGQKQLIAFIRAVLRHPELIILDEATANIDTITEKLLDDILGSLPKATTIVVIAHRLNTIESADQILFINDGLITPAGSLKDAISMLEHNARNS